MKAGSSGDRRAICVSSQVRSGPLGHGEQVAEAMQLIMLVREHCGIVEHDDRAQIGQLVRDRQDLIDVFLILRDKQTAAAVAHLIIDFRMRGGGINAVSDGTERLRGEIADHPFFANVAHDDDAFASLDAKTLQRARRMRH